VSDTVNITKVRLITVCDQMSIPYWFFSDEVAVIDEIQMMRDPQRGWAWTRALLGLQFHSTCMHCISAVNI